MARTGPLLTLLWRPDDALRELHAESLRQHSANTSTLAGSAMTGNLRTARLQFARPVIRGRGARLTPGRAVPVLVRRDVLGLRRQPSAALSGLGLTLLGSVVLAWALTQSAAPVIAVPLGLVPLYLGYGAWAEGLRLQADNVGTPSLLGSGPLEEAGAHLVMPTALTALVLGGSVGVAATVAGGSVPGFGGVAGVALSAVCIVGVLAGGHLMATFRGSPSLQTGPQGLIAWYLLPAVVVLVVGSLLPLLLRAGLGVGIGVSVWLVVAVVLWGLHRVRRLTHLHRW